MKLPKQSWIAALALGAALCPIGWLIYAIPFWRARRPLLPRSGFSDDFGFDLLDKLVHAVLSSLLLLFVLLALLLVLRRRWLAVTALVGLVTLLIHGQLGRDDWVALAPSALFAVLGDAVRHGSRVLRSGSSRRRRGRSSRPGGRARRVPGCRPAPRPSAPRAR